MTNLERLIQAHVEHATTLTLSSATEKIAEDIAREIIADPDWRRAMRAIIEDFSRQTFARLKDNPSPPPARADLQADLRASVERLEAEMQALRDRITDHE